jgi:peptidyl-prolyl cis-trans isomerase C
MIGRSVMLQIKCHPLIVASLLLAAACSDDPAPRGQVVATVDGDDITQSQLDLERSLGGRMAAADGAAGDKLILQRLIDRKLWADAARSRKLDRTASYFLQRGRATDVILANGLAQSVLRDINAPSADDVAHFIDAHPWAFDHRQLLEVAEVFFASNDPVVIEKVTAARSLDDSVAVLTAAHIPFTRNLRRLDSATFSKEDAAHYQQSKIGALNLERQGNGWIVSVLQTRTEIPTPQPERTRLAQQLDRAEQSGAALWRYTQSLRSDADIRYAAGFAPDTH